MCGLVSEQEVIREKRLRSREKDGKNVENLDGDEGWEEIDAESEDGDNVGVVKTGKTKGLRTRTEVSGSSVRAVRVESMWKRRRRWS
ncbi:UNVERIFIED_CONTAM: hypothetical protein Sradi_3167000 [Sesamum radiatum]|uniref:Uncharacterized protein n=1 Tax=Sesamum radiatum TaxID=300843 RepID=A0AAW2RE63_SESRA